MRKGFEDVVRGTGVPVHCHISWSVSMFCEATRDWHLIPPQPPSVCGCIAAFPHPQICPVSTKKAHRIGFSGFNGRSRSRPRVLTQNLYLKMTSAA